MALDTSATIAIIGGGPVGLEAALYARFLGYRVDLYERKRIAERVRQLGDQRLQSPFREISSPLGIAALQAQEPDWRPPRADAILSAEEYLKHYLLPLAASDLLVDHLKTDCDVVAIEHVSEEIVSMDEGVETMSADGDEEPLDATDDLAESNTAFRFQISFRDVLGANRFAQADAVLDCSGAEGLFAVIPNAPSLYFCLSDSSEPSEKSGRSMAECFDRIRGAFALLGGREKLNLYATIQVR